MPSPSTSKAPITGNTSRQKCARPNRSAEPASQPLMAPLRRPIDEGRARIMSLASRRLSALECWVLGVWRQMFTFARRSMERVKWSWAASQPRGRPAGWTAAAHAIQLRVEPPAAPMPLTLQTPAAPLRPARLRRIGRRAPARPNAPTSGRLHPTAACGRARTLRGTQRATCWPSGVDDSAPRARKCPGKSARLGSALRDSSSGQRACR